MAPYFIGIDIGTQGVRVVLLDADGEIAGSAERVFPLNENSREEQSPQHWWDAVVSCLEQLIATVKPVLDLNDIMALAVTSTSGTVIPLDKHNRPLHNAIMYSDQRSGIQAKKATEAAIKYHAKGYTAFNTSSGLAKMAWFVESYPDKAALIHKWVHAADYVTGMLSGRWGITDYTNAFKSGFDVSKLEWPEYVYRHLPLKKEWLPEVVASGTVISTIEASIAIRLGLPLHIKVSVGITDGCASQIASGAMNPGDWNTTIGTTMVIKGVTHNEVIDPQGRVYSHRHPTGYWMPGGASNTGADWVTNEFGNDLIALNAMAKELIPTEYISYPLQQAGERFPFIAPQARGFEPFGLTKAERFTANMEGVAYLERLAFELIMDLSGERVNSVFTAGGGSNSDVWLNIRANVLNLPVYKMKHTSGAVGAAILAASNTLFQSVITAAKALTIIEKEVLPQKELAEKYNGNYYRFIDTLKSKGFI